MNELLGDILLGGIGGGFSRSLRGMLGDTQGEPLFGDCLAWSDRKDDASEAKLLLANHCEGSLQNTSSSTHFKQDKDISSQHLMFPFQQQSYLYVQKSHRTN